MNKNIVILAIETSCDETAAAVLSLTLRGQNLPVFSPQDSSFSEKSFLARNKSVDKKTIMWPKIKTLSSVVKSQIALHKKMGGVVPEVAARAHVKNILPVVEKALVTCSLSLNAIDYIAVTQGPGLIPSLIVGVEFAKALSLATGKPIIPVNHMLGHLYSPLGKIKDLRLKIKDVFPMIALIVSGGHTMLVLISAKGGSASGGKNVLEYKVLGQTVDDAAGEAFDKVAKLLKLPYPGGPEVSKLAEKGKPDFQFPRPMIHDKNYNFSFSGLKTAVLYYLRDNVGAGFSRPKSKAGEQALPLQLKTDICKAFQDAAIDVLVTKTMRAVKEFGAKSISLSGGVAANTALRDALNLQSKILNLNFFVPPKNLCTDNAEMIGLAAAFMLHNGYKTKKYTLIKADSNLEL